MTRRDETSAHIAIREALANAIVHEDYWVNAGIRIIKRPEGLKFINPGSLLVNKEALFTESEQISICRNLLEARYPRQQNHPQQSYRARQQES